MSSSPTEDLRWLIGVVDRFESSWRAGGSPRIESYLESVEGPNRLLLLEELLRVEWALRARCGESPAPGEYERRFPEHTGMIRDIFSPTVLDAVEPRSGGESTGSMAGFPGLGPSTEEAPAASGDLGDPVVPGCLGFYEILEPIGRGGMGAVYKARHRLLKRIVALKVLSIERSVNPAALARFRLEMEAVGRLEHPNIVRASDAGEAGGLHYLIMEYVEGRNLAQYLADRGPLPVAEACAFIRQAAEGLEHAHRHNLVHRDVKPANVMVTRDGRVKLLDLGLALLRGNTTADDLVDGRFVAGTLDYMAPEQAAASPEVDPRADLYSLGCTLYCLLAGHPPFHGPEYRSTLGKLMAHVHRPPPPIRARRSDLPESLVTLIEHLLAKDPADRPASAGALVEALVGIEREILGTPSTPPP